MLLRKGRQSPHPHRHYPVCERGSDGPGATPAKQWAVTPPNELLALCHAGPSVGPRLPLRFCFQRRRQNLCCAGGPPTPHLLADKPVTAGLSVNYRPSKRCVRRPFSPLRKFRASISLTVLLSVCDALGLGPNLYAASIRSRSSLLCLEQFSDAVMMRKLFSTCRPHTRRPCNGIMWST